ncbi:uncharacterized protein LOC124144366 [Haliotis rufescens]|uniref:uncharacterized protein LOC124144366 n=1 Tax=Haliotis rufescens TaxID=6454 RepID=UPI00201EF0D3|nr:uncharacterized protein LOC124144366 [Haliotis rufescens]
MSPQYAQMLSLVFALTWMSTTTRASYGPFQRYATRSYGPPVYPPYRTYYNPLSNCLKMVYGKDMFFRLPFSSMSPLKTLDDSNAQGSVRRSYGDIFMTLGQLKESLGISSSDHINWKDGVHSPDNRPATSASIIGRNGLQINSDVCCSTNEVFFINDTLVDVENITRKIAQLNRIGAYQFIRHGFCAFKGACQGECLQHYINLPLAVDEPGAGLPIMFRFFKVPGYCSCRVIGF